MAKKAAKQGVSKESRPAAAPGKSTRGGGGTEKPKAAVIDFAKLGKEVGKDPRQLRIWARRKDSPRSGDAQAWRTWIEKAIRQRQPKKQKGGMFAEASAVQGQGAEEMSPSRLHGGAAAAPGAAGGDAPLQEAPTPLEIARMTVQLCWGNVKHAIQKGTLGVDDVDSLKKSLQELRQYEVDQIELEKLRGNLIARDLVRELCGNLASRLVRCVGVLEHSIGVEFAVWLGDPEIQAMKADDRARKVREFVKKKCDEVLRIEADAVIAEALKDEAEE